MTKDNFKVFIEDPANKKYFEDIIFTPNYIIEENIEDYENKVDKAKEMAIELLKDNKNEYD